MQEFERFDGTEFVLRQPDAVLESVFSALEQAVQKSNKKAMPKMRTVPKLVEEAKAQDPDTPLSEYFVRRLVKTGKVPHVKVYGKVLIPVEAFYKALEQMGIGEWKKDISCAGLQKIKE